MIKIKCGGGITSTQFFHVYLGQGMEDGIVMKLGVAPWFLSQRAIAVGTTMYIHVVVTEVYTHPQ